MDGVYPPLVAYLNYWVYIALMMIGLFAIAVKKNLVKKVIGLNILQTAVILFFISIAAKRGSTIPILLQGGHGPVTSERYINPLPHVLMLTAIVVAVATLGVALALVIRIYRRYGTLDEDRIMAPDDKTADRTAGDRS
jgi:multicomponent Na+:H+ antiporter subunit C